MKGESAYTSLFVVIGLVTITYGHGNHGNHAPARPGEKKNTAFQNTDITRDTEHIKEHLSEKINQHDINQMSPDELQFQFFVGHDLNRDGLLDGLEIFKSLEHAVDHMPDARQLHQDPAAALERVTGLTDDVLEWQDLNKNGYLDYREFALGHKNAQPNQGESKDKDQGQAQGHAHTHTKQGL